MDNIFEVKDLQYRYRKSDIKAIDGISLNVKKGEIFGLLGPSGAGKSTTQKILTRLLKDYHGDILYKGQDLREFSNDFYEDIGVGFELPVHFSKLSAMENMMFFRRLYKKHDDIETLLDRVGLLEDKDKLVGSFSKGMKMRLNFVRAMLNQPDILFLDEVTNGLDPMNARIIKDMIREFKEEGKTVFLSTHLMNDVEELCDRIAFISQGKIRELSTPRDLKLKFGRRELKVEYFDNGSTKLETFNLDDISQNEAFFDIMRNKQIETVHSGETSLDDIFIKVTGERIDA